MNPKKQIFISLICITLIFGMACCATKQEDRDSNESGVIDMGNGEKYIEVESDNGFTPQDIKKIRDAAAAAMVPDATGKDKAELENILKLADSVIKKCSCT